MVLRSFFIHHAQVNKNRKNARSKCVCELSVFVFLWETGPRGYLNKLANPCCSRTAAKQDNCQLRQLPIRTIANQGAALGLKKLSSIFFTEQLQWIK